MTEDIWQNCKGINHLVMFTTTAWRIQAQDILATRKLVDSVEEQMLLDEMIESNQSLHRLLYLPFRFPPLQQGSRFGTRYEASLWYGSLELSTAMSEAAYYRFHFIRASQVDFGNVITDHIAYAAHIKTNRGVNLMQSPFSKFSQLISSPERYEASQRLGSAMRQDAVESFCYVSARDPNKGMNTGVFTPKAFSSRKLTANSLQSWQCIVDSKVAEFVRLSTSSVESRSFPLDVFMQEGKLPFPAI